MHPILTTTRNALIAAGATAVFAATAQAQQYVHINDSIRGAPSEANNFIATPKGWKQPMTPWGEPDIQSQLNMMQTAGIPLQRCASSYRFGGPPCDMNKKWLTKEEYDQRMEAYSHRTDRSDQLAAKGDLGGALQAGLTDPGIPQWETNLIVDPPNGLLPALTPEGKRLAPTYHSDWPLPGEDLVFDGPKDFDSWDRCITRGMPSSMMHYYYNGGLQIVQAPGYVIFRLEMIHEARIIPTDGRATTSSAIKQWLGVSRGHWEGDTLVVETTNYRVGAPMINLAVIGSPPGNLFPTSEKMKTTERITRLNDDWYLYEITTEDPVILTRPFTVRYPMKNDPSYLMPEYACHEGNTIVQDYVETNRYERAHPKPEPAQPPVEVTPTVADLLAGDWVGTPRIVTVDDHIRLHFTKNADGTVNGKLVGTSFGKIDKPLRDFKIEKNFTVRSFRRGPQSGPGRVIPGPVMTFTFPNINPWRFAGKINDDGTITGIVSSAQGGLPLTFKHVAGNDGG
ncbi:MAG TPA: hypothetical protein VFY39_12375 [Gammaproteobacteria bacterium]|nr:hypothetical protein [Gammaproteobacteria bacterium]